MQRFFIPQPDIKGNILTIQDQRIVYQMKKVLRMKSGDLFSVFDENGKEYSVQFLEAERHQITGNVLEPIERKTEPRLKVVLYQAIPKKTALFELVVQKMTELGAAEIYPLITERTENRRIGKFERMQTIAIEATEQCRRTQVPVLHHPVNFEEVIQKATNPYLAYEMEASQNLIELLPEIQEKKAVSIFIGPEGGFSQKEIETAKKVGVKSFSLGSRILRTETAAIVALGSLLLNQ